MNPRIGIVGGYGNTGRIVVEELAKLPDVDVVLGGRDIGKANEVLSSIKISSVRAVKADALDPQSLKSFCRDLDVVINCASPTCLILDRVARAAMESGAHYIDPGGYARVYRSLQGGNGASSAARGAKDRACLLSAGLVPGIAELLVQHISNQFDNPESVDFYMDGRADMALSVFEDMIHTFFPLEVGSFERGVATPRNRWASKHFEFPKPIGKQRAIPMLWPEIQRFATTRRLPHLGWHVGGTVPFLVLKNVIHPIFKNHTKLGARLLKPSYDLEIRKYGDMYAFIVESEGQKNGERRHITAKIVAKGHEHYRLNAVALVVAAQMILKGEVLPGVHFLADAVNPASFIDGLQPYAVPIQVEEKNSAAHFPE